MRQSLSRNRRRESSPMMMMMMMRRWNQEIGIMTTTSLCREPNRQSQLQLVALLRLLPLPQRLRRLVLTVTATATARRRHLHFRITLTILSIAVIHFFFFFFWNLVQMDFFFFWVKCEWKSIERNNREILGGVHLGLIYKIGFLTLPLVDAESETRNYLKFLFFFF